MGRARTGAPARLALFGGVAGIGVALDQLAKAVAREALAHGPLTLVPGVLDLRLVMNTGAAFSMGEGAQWLFVLLAVVVVAAATVFVARTADLTAPFVASLACVAGGGVGNLIDRVAAGQVTDFLATTFVSFPVFNVADVFVTVGVVASLVCFWRRDERRAAEQGGARV